jgi:hypothetical protein
MNSYDQQTKSFIFSQILSVITQSQPPTSRCQKINQWFDDVLAYKVEISDVLLLPLLEFCLAYSKTFPDSFDLTLLYHKIHKLYRKQRSYRKPLLFGSKALMLLLKLSILKKDMLRFDFLCKDLQKLETQDDEMVAQVQKLYSLDICQSLSSEEVNQETLAKDNEERKALLLKARLRQEFFRKDNFKDTNFELEHVIQLDFVGEFVYQTLLKVLV